MKKITTLSLSIGILLFSLSCTQEDDVTTEMFSTEKLTGSISKKWQTVRTSPNDDQEPASCQLSHPMNLDNYMIFSADGSFEYDNGEITDDEECDTEGCCSDLANLLGYWEISENNDSLTIVIDHVKASFHEDFVSVPEQTFWQAKLVTLTDQLLKVQSIDSEDNITYVIELESR